MSHAVGTPAARRPRRASRLRWRTACATPMTRFAWSSEAAFPVLTLTAPSSAASASARLRRPNAPAAALALRERELRLLSDLGNRLLGGATAAGARAISGECFQRLFPLTSGALYSLDEACTSATAVAVRGEPSAPGPTLASAACGALRRRRGAGGDGAAGLACGHTAHGPSAALCVPLSAAEGVLGVICLVHPVSAPPRSPCGRAGRPRRAAAAPGRQQSGSRSRRRTSSSGRPYACKPCATP